MHRPDHEHPTAGPHRRQGRPDLLDVANTAADHAREAVRALMIEAPDGEFYLAAQPAVAPVLAAYLEVHGYRPRSRAAQVAGRTISQTLSTWTNILPVAPAGTSTSTSAP